MKLSQLVSQPDTQMDLKDSDLWNTKRYQTVILLIASILLNFSKKKLVIMWPYDCKLCTVGNTPYVMLKSHEQIISYCPR